MYAPQLETDSFVFDCFTLLFQRYFLKPSPFPTPFHWLTSVREGGLIESVASLPFFPAHEIISASEEGDKGG